MRLLAGVALVLVSACASHATGKAVVTDAAQALGGAESVWRR
jgi:hypothetical protein